MDEEINCAEWVHAGTAPSCGGKSALPIIGDMGDSGRGSFVGGDEADANAFWSADREAGEVLRR